MKICAVILYAITWIFCFISMYVFKLTVGENIIATTKIRNNYGAIQSFISQFCDSSIGLSLLLLVKLSLLILFTSFLISVLYFFFVMALIQSYCSSIAIAKRLWLLFANALKNIKERQLRAITIWEAIQKRSHEPIYKTYIKFKQRD